MSMVQGISNNWLKNLGGTTHKQQEEWGYLREINFVREDQDGVNFDELQDAAAINKLCFDKGIALSHLVKRKESLEEQFLELTKTK